MRHSLLQFKMKQRFKRQMNAEVGNEGMGIAVFFFCWGVFDRIYGRK